MSLFEGMAAGFGEGQGQYNMKMMDFLNQKSQTMAQLYSHLADTLIQSGGDQDIASEFLGRAHNWATANPLLDPKGYSQLVKSERGGIHDIVDKAHQRNVAGYNQQQFGGAGGGQPQESLGGFLDRTGQSVAAREGQVPAQTTPTSGLDQALSNAGVPSGPPPGMTVTHPGTAPTPTQTPGMGGIGAGLQLPNMQDMLTQITGGQPMFGALGAPTAMGRMAMQVAPEVMKTRLDLANKMAIINSMFAGGMGGLDPRSPSGSSLFAEKMRPFGLNVPVTQWRNIPRTLLKDDNGQYFVAPTMKSWRDGSTWLRTGPGQEVEVNPLDEEPKVVTGKDGSQFVSSPAVKGGLIPLGGHLPVVMGRTVTTSPTYTGGTARGEVIQFSGGQSGAAPGKAPGVYVPPPGVPLDLPPGLPPSADLGKPSGRTSTGKPSEAYKRQGYSLEQLQSSPDYTDRKIAKIITHPEEFDLTGRDKAYWDYLFDQRTGGQLSAPVPLKDFKSSFQDQRKAIVTGFLASRDISNTLNDTDGQLVGWISGKILVEMNKLGTAAGMKLVFDPSQNIKDLSDQVDPHSALGQQAARQAVQDVIAEHPQAAHALQTRGDQLAAKAADFITTTRLFNFADVRNTIGGVQGVSRVYQFIKDALLNPGMDPQAILGHLGAINRNMADGLYALEQARWGEKIPYIREKEIMSQMYWPDYIEGLVHKLQAGAAQKGNNLSRQDALFLLWRNGQIQADPGNNVKVEYNK